MVRAVKVTGIMQMQTSKRKKAQLLALSLSPAQVERLLRGEQAPIRLFLRVYQREYRGSLPPPEVMKAMGYTEEWDGWETPEQGPTAVLIALHARRARLSPVERAPQVPPGHLIATAQLGGIVWERDRFAWLLSDVTALPEPLPCEGRPGARPGVFQVPPQITARLLPRSERAHARRASAQGSRKSDGQVPARP